jgi:hypothetical protein
MTDLSTLFQKIIRCILGKHRQNAIYQNLFCFRAL